MHLVRARDERGRATITLAVLVSTSVFASVGLVFASEDNGSHKRLPDVSTLSVKSLPAPAEGSRILARDGTELGMLIGPEKRTVVPLDKISRIMIDATIAVEDRRFFSHNGIDLRGVARAAKTDIEHGEIREGGSTITQQYVRNTFLGTQKTFRRKMEEVGLALAVESSHSKNKILEAYLNTAYFGEGVYGVEAASRFYFSIGAEELTTAQAALLVALLPSPSEYSPIANPELALRRRNAVLAEMASTEVIAPAEAEALSQQPLELRPLKTEDIKMAPYFVEYVKQMLLDDKRLGKTPKARYDALFGGGLTIKTSLDPKLQVVVEQAATKLPRGVPEAAIVVMDHSNGEILGYYGGHDFGANKFDLVSQARRQPGSAFKTFALVSALQQGYSPNLPLSGSSPCVRPGWSKPVRNFGNSSFGGVTLRKATHKSINCAYAQLVTKYIKPADVEATAHRMGITSKLTTYPSITLGAVDVSPLEMTRAYGTLAADGKRPPIRPILQVRDRAGRLLFAPDDKGQPSLPPNVARMTTNILEGVVTSGTATRARFDWPAAGKTGTTQNNRDAWFVGYTPRLVAAVWVGHREGAVKMNSVTGGTVCAGIWRTVMVAAHEGLEPTSFTEPDEDQFKRFHLDPTKKTKPRARRVTPATASPSPAAPEEPAAPAPSAVPEPVAPPEPAPSIAPPPEPSPT